MHERRREAPALLIHKVLSEPGTTSPVSKWQGFEVPVMQPSPILDRITLPESNIAQAEQLGRHAALVPESDFTDLLREAMQISEKEHIETVVFSAQELIESDGNRVTPETVEFAKHFRPDILVVNDNGDKKIIVQRADIIAAEYACAAGGMG